MKRPFLAFFLSFILPGAGLWYLGKWKCGFVNLGAVLLLGFVLAVFLPEEVFDKYIQYVAVGCAAGSGGLSQAIAQQMNQRIQ